MQDYLKRYTTRFFDETDISPDDYIKHCKNNANEAHNIPLEVKNNIKLMYTEQGLYAQAVMIIRKDL